MFEWTRKKAVREGLFSLFIGDRTAAFAIMTALLLPVFIILMGLLFEGGRGLSYFLQSKRVMALACERSTKPTRTDVGADSTRRENVLTTFDAMIQSTKQKVLERDVTINWLQTDIKAEFSYRLLFADMFDVDEMKYRLAYSCEGIPPYPYDGEVLVDNNFENNTLGRERILKNGITTQTPSGCWGVYPYTELKWHGGTGPGIELQDWSSPCCRKIHAWEGYPEGFEKEAEKGDETANDKACKLKGNEKAVQSSDRPLFEEGANSSLASLPTRYVIELDSDWGTSIQGKKRTDANSSIYKDVELHPGKYEISVWYNGRKSSFNNVKSAELTNGIDISLQPLLPQSGAVKTIFQMKQGPGMKNAIDQVIRWRQYREQITVDTYSIYRLTIAASGLSDSFGGIITGFELRYIGRYGDERS